MSGYSAGNSILGMYPGVNVFCGGITHRDLK